MRYRTDPMTQNRKKWFRSQKKSILAKKIDNNIFFNFLKKFFGPAVFCKCFYPFYTCIICDMGPIRWLKIEKSDLEIEKSPFWTYFEKNSKSRVTWPHNGVKNFFRIFQLNSKKKKIGFLKFTFPKKWGRKYKSRTRFFPDMVSIQKL